jgi:GT2 family glycosyltransferase
MLDHAFAVDAWAARWYTGPVMEPQLAIVIVSHNSARWLAPCLASIKAHAGGLAVDVVVVDAESLDDTAAVVEAHPTARMIRCRNLGFAHANNRGIEATTADWLLLLNPDTELVAGTLADLVARAAAAPDVGVVGVRQVAADGSLQFSMRRFPSVLRSLGEALASESWPVHPARLGERVLDARLYEQETDCDWTSGSFMLLRRDALRQTELLDERFFLYAEEPDLCLRLRVAGWKTRHLPYVTIVHHGGNESSDPRLAAQRAYSRRLLMRKHFSRPREVLGIGAMALGYALRAAAGRPTARAALATTLGLRPPPFD